MRRLSPLTIFFLILTAIFFVYIPLKACLTDGRAHTLKTSGDVLTEALDNDDRSIPMSIIKEAYALVVIPGTFKQTIVFGARYRDGMLMLRTEDGRWSSPVFVRLVRGNTELERKLSFQDTILFFKSKTVVDLLEKRELDSDARLVVARGPFQMGPSEEIGWRDGVEVYFYLMRKGRWSDKAFPGGRLEIDRKGNEDFYGARDIIPAMITGGGADMWRPLTVEKKVESFPIYRFSYFQ